MEEMLEYFLREHKLIEDAELIGKQCVTYDNKIGIIIGFEDNESFADYYFIIYVPEIHRVRFELANDPTFIKAIL